MIVASSTHAPSGFFASNGGFEFPAVLGASAAALALTGPGALSLDHALGHRLNQPWMRTLALAAVIPAAAAVIARRRRHLASTQPRSGARPGAKRHRRSRRPVSRAVAALYWLRKGRDPVNVRGGGSSRRLLRLAALARTEPVRVKPRRRLVRTAP